jgi:hypothetical protein
MLETGIPIQIKELTLGDVFTYILSDEWGLSPELPIEGTQLVDASTCDSVHYDNPNEEDEGENER